MTTFSSTAVDRPLHNRSRRPSAGTVQLEYWWINRWGCQQAKLNLVRNCGPIYNLVEDIAIQVNNCAPLAMYVLWGMYAICPAWRYI